jgi:hypothetical protein
MDAALFLKIGADAGDLQREMVKSSDSLGNFEDSARKAESRGGGLFGALSKGVGSVKSLLGPVGSLVDAGGGLIDFLNDAGKAGAAEKLEQDQLLKSIQNTDKGFRGTSDTLDQYITKAQQLAFGDTEARESLSKLTAATHDVTKASSLQAQAMDFARAKHISLAEATTVYSKVAMGQTAILKRYGVEVDKNTSITDAFAMAQASTTGAAELFASSQEGAGIRAAAAMQDAKESIGAAVAPLQNQILGGLSSFLTGPMFQGALTMIVNLLGVLVPQALTFLQTTFSPLLATLQTVGQYLLATASGGAGAYDLFQKLPEPIQPLVHFLGSLVDNFHNLFDALTSGADPLQAFGSLLTDNLGALTNDLLPGLANLGQMFVDWVGPMIPPLLAKLTDLGGQVLGWITGTGLPLLVSKLSEWGGALVAWIGPMIPPLLAKLQELGGQVLGWITGTALPLVVSKLSEWGGALVAWVGPQIPPLLAKLADLGGQLLGWITGTALPLVVSKLSEWGGAFIAWIGPQIPPLLANLADLGGKLLGWIVGTALPGLISKLSEWGGAFVKWVVDNDVAGKLLGGLGGLLGGVLGWIIGDALPGLIGKLVEWGGAFIKWVADNDVIGKLLGGLAGLLGGILHWVIFDALPGLVTKLVEWGTAFIKWIADNDVVGKLGGALGGVADGIWGWITSTAKDILVKVVVMGTNIVSGIQKGISDAWTGFTSWLHDKIADIPVIGALVLDSHSPSRRMAKLGVGAVDGLRVGWQKGQAAMLRAVRGTMGLMNGVVSGATLGGPTAAAGGFGAGATFIPARAAAAVQPITVNLTVYIDGQDVTSRARVVLEGAGKYDRLVNPRK